MQLNKTMGGLLHKFFSHNGVESTLIFAGTLEHKAALELQRHGVLGIRPHHDCTGKVHQFVVEAFRVCCRKD